MHELGTDSPLMVVVHHKIVSLRFDFFAGTNDVDAEVQVLLWDTLMNQYAAYFGDWAAMQLSPKPATTPDAIARNVAVAGSKMTLKEAQRVFGADVVTEDNYRR